MNLDMLLDQLEELAWDEQVEFELGERNPGLIEDGVKEIELKISKLGAQLTPALLDVLEVHEDGDPCWLLRLCPHVPGDDCKTRAARFLNDEDSEVQYWANCVLDQLKDTGG